MKAYTTEFQYQRMMKANTELEARLRRINLQIADIQKHALDLNDESTFQPLQNEADLINAQSFSLDDYLVVDPPVNGAVVIGTSVTVANGSRKTETYHVVGVGIIDWDAGEVSYNSPIGKGLLGAKVGDTREIKTPSGIKTFNVRKIAKYEPTQD